MRWLKIYHLLFCVAFLSITVKCVINVNEENEYGSSRLNRTRKIKPAANKDVNSKIVHKAHTKQNNKTAKDDLQPSKLRDAETYSNLSSRKTATFSPSTDPKEVFTESTITKSSNFQSKPLTSSIPTENLNVISGINSENTDFQRKPLSAFILDSRVSEIQTISGSDLTKKRKNGQLNLNEIDLSEILLAADIEGGLHAISRSTGKKLWSIIEGPNVQPLVHIQEHFLNAENDFLNTSRSHLGSDTLIVEPFGDGSLFFFNIFTGLHKIPASIKQLVDQSPIDLKTEVVVDADGTTIEDEKIYTGYKKTAIYSIDLLTGDILAAYGPGTENKMYTPDNSKKKSCYKFDESTTLANSSSKTSSQSETNNCAQIINIGKTVYELIIHSPIDNSYYNITYSNWQYNNLDSMLAFKHKYSTDGLSISPFRDCSLLAVDSVGHFAKWLTPKFPGIINNIFDIFVDPESQGKFLLPHPLNCFPSVADSYNDPLFFDHYNKVYDDNASMTSVYLDKSMDNTWFAMSSVNYPTLVDAAPMAKYEMSPRWRNPNFLSDPDMFETSVIGVHVLKADTYSNIQAGNERLPNNLEDFTEQNPDNLPALPNYRPDHSFMEPINYNPSKDLQHYISEKELSLYKKKVQEEVTKQLELKNKNSIPYIIGQFIYRSFKAIAAVGMCVMTFIFLRKFDVFSTKKREVKETISVSTDENSNDKADKLLQQEGQLYTENSFDEADDSEERLTNVAGSTKKKRKRGKRGGQKGNNKAQGAVTTVQIYGEDQNSNEIKVTNQKDNNLVNIKLSSKVLGYGSSGTVVYQGTFQERPVAVKRLLLDFYDIASQEIKLLSMSDDHPNVVRYYCSEQTDKFLYIALELCTASLDIVIEEKTKHSNKVQEIAENLDLLDILFQLTQGVQHLHSLKIVHRDLKPQNILLAPSKKYVSHGNKEKKIRTLISDFGLCKKLEAEESSFRTNMRDPAGTTGWRAPELLRGKVSALSQLSSIQSEDEMSNFSSHNSSKSVEPIVYDPITHVRLTRAVDIFSMGCIFYYVLSRGKHPFGEKYVRESNILKSKYNLGAILLDEKYLAIEAEDLIAKMISNNPHNRPTANVILKHPLFWSKTKKLDFLLKVSDRFEVERRDPPSSLLLKLEEISPVVITNGDWTAKFDQVFINNLGKYRKYNGGRIMDLLRTFRNKYHHFMDLPEELQILLGPYPEGFFSYYTKRFPNLVIEIYYVVQKNLKDDQILKEFF
ncbi:hypothetical protein ACO0RG_000660 [Hanseniaspora osmophila]